MRQAQRLLYRRRDKEEIDNEANEDGEHNALLKK